jgi:hypothetical protein
METTAEAKNNSPTHTGKKAIPKKNGFFYNSF